MIREQRFLRNIELRSSGPNGNTLSGYAAKFSPARSQDLGGFVETIAPGAFDKTLASGADVRFLRDHNPTLIFGRTRAGTLDLYADRVGLRFSCDMPDTTQARDLLESVRRGDVSQCSFSFTVDDEDWSDDSDEEGNSMPLRTLRAVSLLDVSCVTWPAYPDTEVNVDPALVMGRALFPDGIPVEVRSRVPGITQVRATTVERRRSLVNRVLGL